MTVLYVDVSKHDRNRRGGLLDWDAIRAATSPVMCARASYGDPAGYNPASPYFGEMAAGAAAAGFLVGAYHNLIRGDQASINRQVDYLRREMDRHNAVWAMCDVEPYPELVSNGLWPRVDDVRQFHDRWHERDSRVLCWYIPKWFWSGASGPNLGSMDLTVLRGPLVQSHYAGGDGTAAQIYAAAGGDSGTGWDDRYGGRLPEIWQFTSAANVPGASGSTDVNAYRGTLTELRTLLTGQTGDDPMATVNINQADWDALIWRVEAMANMKPTYGGGGASLEGKPVPFVAAIKALAGDQVDEAAIITGVLAGLSPQAIADLVVAALPPELARGVADELAARLQA